MQIDWATVITVFPHIRPADTEFVGADIIFLQGLQLRVLLECGYYSRVWIILKKPAFFHKFVYFGWHHVKQIEHF